jgi:serine/threonine protein kinase
MMRLTLALLVLTPMLLIAGHPKKRAPTSAPPSVTVATPSEVADQKDPEEYLEEWSVKTVQKEIPLRKLSKSRLRLLSMKERIKVAMDIMRQIKHCEEANVTRKNLGASGIVVRLGMNVNQERMVEGAMKGPVATTLTTSARKPRAAKPTTRFVPPEIAGKGKISQKSMPSANLFALGCTFWQMYFGKEPAWVSANKGKIPGTKKKQRKAREYLITVIRQREVAKLPKGKNPHLKDKQLFLKTILKLTDSNAQARGTAKEAYETLFKAYTGKNLAQPTPGDTNKDKKDSGKKTKSNSKKQKRQTA